MHRDNRVRIYAFVIMPHHLHIVWKIVEPQTRETVQRDFLKFTSQQLLFKIQAEQPQLLEKFKVNAKDRMHQLWQRGALNILLYNDLVREQKINYIHNNPVMRKWKLAATPEDYKYSSAAFYVNDDKSYDFITAFRG